MGMVIVFGSQKGSVGKSTIAGAMGISFMELGYSVYIVDADIGQDTVYDFVKDRAELAGKEAPIASKMKGQIRQQVKQLAEKFDVVIVDTGGKEGVEFVSAGLTADMIISPIEYGGAESRTLATVEKELTQVRTLNEDVPVYFVGTRLSAHSAHNDLEEIRDNINEEYPGIGTVCKSGLTFYREWKKMFLTGLSITELKQPKATAEFEALMHELFPEIMKGKVPR